MALLKTIENSDTGHTNDYWRIISINIDTKTNQVCIILGGYKDKDTRDNNKNPDATKEIYMTVNEVLSSKQYSALATALYQRLSEPILAPAIDNEGYRVDIDQNLFTDAEKI